MTMKTRKVAERFIASLECSPQLRVPLQELGQLLVTFPVIGGGHGCIVLRVEDAIVRLSEQGGLWLAEELVVRATEW